MPWWVPSPPAGAQRRPGLRSAPWWWSSPWSVPPRTSRLGRFLHRLGDIGLLTAKLADLLFERLQAPLVLVALGLLEQQAAVAQRLVDAVDPQAQKTDTKLGTRLGRIERRGVAVRAEVAE